MSLISAAFSSRIYVPFGHVGFLHCSHILCSTPRFSLPAGPWPGKSANEDMQIRNSARKSVGGIKFYSLFSPSVLFWDITRLYCSIRQPMIRECFPVFKLVYLLSMWYFSFPFQTCISVVLFRSLMSRHFLFHSGQIWDKNFGQLVKSIGIDHRKGSR